MRREESWYTATGRTASQFGYASVTPTYRLEGQLILLEPTPDAARTDGLWIQCEYTPARLTTGAKLDLRFPDIMETVLIHDVVVTALRVEASRGESKSNGLDDAVRERDEVLYLWQEFIQDRSSGPVSGTPYYLGD